MARMLALVVVLTLPCVVMADDKPKAADLALARKALTVSRELTRIVGEGHIEEGVRIHVDTQSVLEAIAGEEFTRMEPAARAEAEAVMRMAFEPALAEALATKPPARTVHHAASPPTKGRVTVTLTIKGRPPPPGGLRLMFEERDGRVRVVDLGTGVNPVVTILRESYGAAPKRGAWAPLAFVRRLVDAKLLAKRFPRSVLQQPLPAPNPTWLSRDLLMQRVELPILTGAPKDESARKALALPWQVVTLDRAGRLGFRPDGRHGPLRRFDLSSVDPGEQDDAIQALVKALVQATKDPAARAKDGASNFGVLIYADRGAKWKYVQWIMGACAHPKVRVRRVALAASRSETAGAAALAAPGEDARHGRIDIVLPTDASIAAQAPAKIRIKLFRRDMHDPSRAYTLAKIDNDRRSYSLPRGWSGRRTEQVERVNHYEHTIGAIQSTIAAKIKAHAKQGAAVRGEIVTPPPKGGSVPYEDILRIIHMLRELGVQDIVFEGAATPLTGRERAARKGRRR